MVNMQELLRQELVLDDASASTPVAYEESGRLHLLSIFEGTFGLRVLSNARVHRAEHEIVVEGGNVEWDFRVPVMCSGVVSAAKTSTFIIYPDQPSYIRPPRPLRARQLTPTKIVAGVSTVETRSDFMAIFEITTTKEWAKNLAPRLEQRLAVSLDRARTLQLEGEAALTILDVVAVVGVLGILSCLRSIPSQVTKAKTPLLFQMMEAARFVFVHMPYSGSPTSKSVGGSIRGRELLGAPTASGSGST